MTGENAWERKEGWACLAKLYRGGLGSVERNLGIPTVVRALGIHLARLNAFMLSSKREDYGGEISISPSTDLALRLELRVARCYSGNVRL